MEKKSIARAFLPLLLVFIIISGFFVTGRNLLQRWNLNQDVLLVGNLILFAATAISFYLYLRSFGDNKPHIFLRMIYSGMFLKMFICLIAAFLYISSVGKGVNKGSIFVLMFLYLLYSGIEITRLMKFSKQRKNA